MHSASEFVSRNRTARHGGAFFAGVGAFLLVMVIFGSACEKSEQQQATPLAGDQAESDQDLDVGDDSSLAASTADDHSQGIAFLKQAMKVVEGPHGPLPVPDISSLEPEIRAQIVNARSDATNAPNDADAIGHLAMLYQAYDLLPAAEQWYRRAIQLDRDEFRWTYLLAHTFAVERKLDDCVSALVIAIRLKPNYVPARIMLAMTLLRGGALNDAAEAVQDLLSYDNDSPIVLYTAGMTYLARQEYVSAVEYLKPLLDRHPEMGGVRKALATAFRELDQAEKADAMLAGRELNTLVPRLSDPERARPYQLAVGVAANIRMAQAYLQTGDAEQALEHFDRALSSSPSQVEALRGKARALIALNEVEQARSILRTLLSLNKKDVDAWIQLGDLELMLHQADEAEAVTRQLQRLDSDNVLIPAMQARIAMERKQYDLAVAAYEQLADRNPDNAKVFVELGNAYELVGDSAKSETAYKQVLKLSPDSAYPMHRLARIYAARKDYGAAFTWFKRALEHNKSVPLVYLDFAKAAIDARNFEAARDVLVNGVKEHPEDPDLAMVLARFYALAPDQSLHNAAEALRLFEKWKDAPQAKTRVAVDTRAVALAAAGKQDEAVNVLRTAIDEASGSGDESMIGDMQRHLAMIKNGEEIAEKAVFVEGDQPPATD